MDDKLIDQKQAVITKLINEAQQEFKQNQVVGQTEEEKMKSASITQDSFKSSDSQLLEHNIKRARDQIQQDYLNQS